MFVKMPVEYLLTVELSSSSLLQESEKHEHRVVFVGNYFVGYFSEDYSTLFSLY